MCSTLTGQQGQAQAALLSDGHHLVLLLAMATVRDGQALGSCQHSADYQTTAAAREDERLQVIRNPER